MNFLVRDIQCAVCHKPVEKIEHMQHPMTRHDVYVVHCHGATEQTTLSMVDIIQATEIQGGVAFSTKQISEPVSDSLDGAGRLGQR